MTPKISEKKQLFHVQYLFNGVTIGNFRKIATSKKTEQKEGKIRCISKVLEPLYLDSIIKWA